MCFGKRKTIHNVSCSYCFNKVNEHIAVCHVFSMGKLNGLFLCHKCLLNKRRRENMSIIKGDCKELKNEPTYI